MAKLVFDIETSSLPLEQFDEGQQEYLFRECQKIADETARATRHAEIRQQFNLWPFTAQVVCIAMLNAETARGKVLFTADDFDDEGAEPGPVEFVPCVDEVEMLGQFWDLAQRFETVVTFNGRGFDVPFIYLRSALLNVPITRKDWLGYRYQTDPHCDLAEQFTFYNVSGREGAARRFNLDFYCKAFGIESPKSHGVTGMDVNSLMAEGRYRDIAEYCLRDVKATVQLYQIWRDRLAGIKQACAMKLVCFAVKEEAKAFQKLAGTSDAQVLVTGMGRRNAEKSFCARVENEKPELVITSGFAGGLNPAFKLGDVVYDADASVTIIAKLAAAGARPAKFVCVEKVASTAREKRTLRAASGADAVEMESEAIRGICRAAKIPSATVRVILDTAGEDLALDFNEFMDENQRLNTAKLAWAVARSPSKIGALLQLQKNSKAAAERLAQVLNAMLQAQAEQFEPWRPYAGKPPSS